jgi:uncharacterized protein
MDRSEWIAVHPVTQDVYVALTNNSRRGSSGQPGPDPANPRASNVYGHIVKWREQGGDSAALKSRWDMFALAGEDKGFGSPDGLWFDPDGILWIQTDASTSTLNRGPYAKIANNPRCSPPMSRPARSAAFSPAAGCEIAGATMSPDGRSLFLNVQHPGRTCERAQQSRCAASRLQLA